MRRVALVYDERAFSRAAAAAAAAVTPAFGYVTLIRVSIDTNAASSVGLTS